jgi:DNA polymerase elongation subunit (family B)
MAVWFITDNGERVKLVDKFSRRIYVSGKTSDLSNLTKKLEDDGDLSFHLATKCADFMSSAKKPVLEITLNGNQDISSFAREIIGYGGYKRFRVHNVDVPISQAYLYEKNVFPLARVVAIDNGKGICYDVLDSVEDLDYVVPSFLSMWLDVGVRKKTVARNFTDEIDLISLQFGKEKIVIDRGDEADKILDLTCILNEVDPDLVFTKGGDSFILPYLSYRASANGVLNHFVLGREGIPLRIDRRRGKTFFSYGRVYHTAPTRRLHGRIHIDVDNTFIYSSCGLDGLIEVSRICRVPLHKSARASIGTIMSSLQLYVAWRNDILIPWNKQEAESFKSGWDLLVADRGGFIFEPKLGFFTDVVEVDFTSMFPMLMWKYNVSGETVLCGCCSESKFRVPELDYNICEKRRGIVPMTLDILLKKRLAYKQSMKKVGGSLKKHVFDLRQTALKWILVTCFGYLGYRNSRFGRVDAHIAVCALARNTLLQTARMAEESGFKVIHGIVDSLWLKKSGVKSKEVRGFCRKVSNAVDVPLNMEGKYRWIVFLPSKIFEGVPVLNRYYGVFEDGTIKMRGIEARRRDTPSFICKVQVKMIEELAKSSVFREFLAKIPTALDVLESQAKMLLSNQIDNTELLIRKRLSKSPSSYNHVVLQAIAAKQLKKAGFEVNPGQNIRYLIVNSRSENGNNRVLAAELLEPETRYDAKKYLDMLVSAAETLFGVFGYSAPTILERVLE